MSALRRKDLERLKDFVVDEDMSYRDMLRLVAATIERLDERAE